jgi:hypothetical protein
VLEYELEYELDSVVEGVAEGEIWATARLMEMERMTNKARTRMMNINLYLRKLLLERRDCFFLV